MKRTKPQEEQSYVEAIRPKLRPVLIGLQAKAKAKAIAKVTTDGSVDDDVEAPRWRIGVWTLLRVGRRKWIE